MSPEADGWFVERGIGEDRAVLLERGAVVAARLDWPGALAAGQIEDAVLVHRAAGSPRGTARFASGEEALVDRLARDAAEGAPIRLEITRAALAERGRLKRAQARPTDAEPRSAPTLHEMLPDASVVHRFPEGADWEALFGESWDGETTFDGETLLFSDTPAMTLIDVDTPAERAPALAAAHAAAAAIRRLDLSGAIGIDFPSLAAKADRRAVDAALDEALAGWPHERTAMNGFGFVQLIARATRPSILHRVARHRTAAAARLLLRRAERLDGPGRTLLTAHPAIAAKLRDEWLAELERRTARPVELARDPKLALDAGHAQIALQ